MSGTLLDDLASRLSSASDSILRAPEAATAPEPLRAIAEQCVFDVAPGGMYPLVERFDGGALVEVLWADGEQHVVAVASGSGVVAAVVTPDQGEADALYAGLAERLGLRGETCQGCGTAIVSVYQYCADCT